MMSEMAVDDGSTKRDKNVNVNVNIVVNTAYVILSYMVWYILQTTPIRIQVLRLNTGNKSTEH